MTRPHLTRRDQNAFRLKKIQPAKINRP